MIKEKANISTPSEGDNSFKLLYYLEFIYFSSFYLGQRQDS